MSIYKLVNNIHSKYMASDSVIHYMEKNKIEYPYIVADLHDNNINPKYYLKMLVDNYIEHTNYYWDKPIFNSPAIHYNSIQEAINSVLESGSTIHMFNDYNDYLNYLNGNQVKMFEIVRNLSSVDSNYSPININKLVTVTSFVNGTAIVVATKDDVFEHLHHYSYNNSFKFNSLSYFGFNSTTEIFTDSRALFKDKMRNGFKIYIFDTIDDYFNFIKNR